MTQYTKNKPETIQAMFGHIAKQYDRTNGILSFQMHRLWNKELVKLISRKNDGKTIADLCCGTGEIAFTYLKNSEQPKKAYLIDFCSGMLQCAKEKASQRNFQHHSLEYIEADVQAIPLEHSKVDCATMAYGIRNVQDPEKCIGEVYRILKPGGIFGILELTEPSHPWLKKGHRFYLSSILPVIGKWVAKDKEAYQYLCNSIQNFSKPNEIAMMMQRTGYIETSCKPLFGGIATIISGVKPAPSPNF